VIYKRIYQGNKVSFRTVELGAQDQLSKNLDVLGWKNRSDSVKGVPSRKISNEFKLSAYDI
jgi:hypothetical protein